MNTDQLIQELSNLLIRYLSLNNLSTQSYIDVLDALRNARLSYREFIYKMKE